MERKIQAVGAQSLDDHAFKAVPHEIEIEDLSRVSLTVFSVKMQHRDAQQAPERFVEEAGMHRFSERALAHHAPRQISRRAVRLLIEEVAPAAESLTDQEADHGDIENGHELHLLDFGDAQSAEQCADDAAVDGESALMNRKNLERMGAVIVPLENAEIQPCADDARDKTDEHAVKQLVAVDVVARRFCKMA